MWERLPACPKLDQKERQARCLSHGDGRERSDLKKGLKITAVVLVCLIGIWCGLLSLQKEWITPLPGVRMTPRLPILKEEDIPPGAIQKLFFRAVDFSSITNEFPGDEYSALTTQLWDNASFSNLAAYLEEAHTNIMLARQVGMAEDMQVLSVISFSQPMVYVAGTRQIARMCDASARKKAAEGDSSGAYNDLLIGIRLGIALSRGGPLINSLVDVACSGICLRSLFQVSVNYSLSPEGAESVMKGLADIEDHIGPLAEVYRWEYVAFSNGIDEVLSDPGQFFGWHGPGGDWYGIARTAGALLGSRPESIVDRMKWCYAHVISGLDTNGYTGTNSYDEILPQSEATGLRDCLGYRDPLAYMICSWILGNIEAVASRYYIRLFMLRAGRLFLAVDQYEKKYGRCPAGLQDLVPEYLEGIPLDPFDGKPLRFKSGKDGEWLIYSVGRNQCDDGGVGSLERHDADLVIRRDAYRLTTNAASASGFPE